MDSRELAGAAAAALALAAITWVISFGGAARLRTQLDASISAGDGEQPVQFGDQLKTGTCPDKWRPHTPAGAHIGPHRMYHHPKGCSPNLTAPMQLAEDWRYSPPAEGSLLWPRPRPAPRRARPAAAGC